jgi:hypothetical protein
MSHSGLLSLLLRVPPLIASRFPWVLRRDDPWPECSKREDSDTFANWSWRWVWGSAYSTWRRIWSGYLLRICSWGPADLGRKVCPRSSSRPSARRRAWGDWVELEAARTAALNDSSKNENSFSINYESKKKDRNQSRLKEIDQFKS